MKRRRSRLEQEIHNRWSKVHEIKLSEDISGESPQAAWTQNTKLLEQLEGEITELQEKITELEQLLQTEDNLLFLQVGTDRKPTAQSIKMCFCTTKLIFQFCFVSAEIPTPLVVTENT